MRKPSVQTTLLLLGGFAAGVFLTSYSHSCRDSASPEGCVCGEQAARLVSRAARADGTCSGASVLQPTLPPAEEEDIRRFLHASQLHDADTPGGSKPPTRLREEYKFKRSVLVGVLTQQSYLRTRAKALYETWGREADKLIFFVGRDCNITSDVSHLPIVKLEVPDQVYPPLRKAFAVLDYMYKKHMDDFNWFIRADDDMYARMDKLSELLAQMHPNEEVYLGRSGTGRPEDLERLRLAGHERYCMGGPGVILSSAAMRGLGPRLPHCLTAVLQHDRQSEVQWNDDDVEIGRCLSRFLDIQCSHSLESTARFYFDYKGASLNPLTLWSKAQLQRVITIHPIKDPNVMRSVHHFYKTVYFELHYSKLSALATDINHLCSLLPSELAPPYTVLTAGCSLALHPELSYLNSSNRVSHLGRAPGGFLERKDHISSSNPQSKFETSAWLRFNSSKLQDMHGAAPEYVPHSSLRLEIATVLKMLRGYTAAQIHPRKSQLLALGDCYVRFNPLIGREYIFTLRFKTDRGPLMKRYRISRELSPSLSISEEHVNTLSPTVHVILPLPRIDSRLEHFLSHYSSLQRYSAGKLHLVAVVFSDGDADQVEEILQMNLESSLSAFVSIAIGQAPYTRSKAIDIGMAALEQPNSLVFLADVDVSFSSDFLQRCRSNALPGRRVYYPAAFWHYYSREGTRLVSSEGRWGFYNFWLACLYKQDYDAVGGYTDSMYSVDLFERFSASRIEVLQAPDPALFHKWSLATCGDLKSSRAQMCKGLAKAASFDQAELTDFLMELSQKDSGFSFTDNSIR